MTRPRDTQAEQQLQAAIDQGKRAYFSEDYDDEHDALAALLDALGQGIPPDCTCPGRTTEHETGCPVIPWQNAGRESET